MNNEPNSKCQLCRWYEQCKEMTDLVTEDCDDYDPMDDSIDIQNYEDDLAEREDLYKKYVEDYNKLIFGMN